ncbi:uroporphyrinogen-III synthase [Brachybacterium endophyticum]|uniref:Uroporphyrinogen-III synthase n=1 Tax=Brachybacterium endophyticum TaxID=2182385 RepID=A0A2U2RKM0_9MICO|nr:uroporphyrinogen-III synthase [Brachybacterium endophyticum]PWH06410.1 uroporphyrinogen-III synthase [Brachybacterium endophyticum]
MITRRVLLPRPEGRGDDLSDLLEVAGYDVVRAPFVQLDPVPAEDLLPALARLAGGAYDLLVVTSPASVRALVSADPAPTVSPGTEVIAVGGATTRALHEAGLDVDLVAGGSGAALVETVRRREAERRETERREVEGQETAERDPATASGAASDAASADRVRPRRVLFPASSAAAPTVREGLQDLGMDVDQVEAYHPRSAPLPTAITGDLAGGAIDAIVLTSPMIARRAAEIGVHPRTAVIVIGHPTQEAAEAAGLRIDARAEHPDAPSLARAVHLALTRLTDPDHTSPDPKESTR